MPIILEALQKAEREVKQTRNNLTSGEGTEPWEKAWETMVGRATKPGVKRQGRPRLKRRPLAAAVLVIAVLVAGVVAADLRLRSAAVTAVPAKREASHPPNTPQAPQWKGPVTLKGEIAHGLKIEMHLNREGSNLSGSYFYERIGRDIQVRGTIGETGSIVLEEFVGRQNTGVFVGNLVSATRVEGKWSKPGSTRYRDFFLMSIGLPLDKVGDGVCQPEISGT